tara:strand:- start:1072 stop:1503 length:432 start_codon:yes stop_codon:yes gene_type:complete
MLATVDGCNDDGIGVKEVTENLTRIGQLEDALTDLWNGSVDLIEEEQACVVAALIQPVRGTERRNVAISAGQTNEVALGHLRCTALDYREVHIGRDLIDKLGLADAMATAKHEGLLNREDVRSNSCKSLEIDSHGTYSIIGQG